MVEVSRPRKSNKPLQLQDIHIAEPLPWVIEANERAVERMKLEYEHAVEVIKRLLGHHGRMISASKSGYSRRYPTRFPVFNACLFLNGVSVRWGDVCLTEDSKKLYEIACELRCDLHLFREHDARWLKEGELPDFRLAVYYVEGAKPADYIPDNSHTRYLVWRNGKIRVDRRATREEDE